MRIAIIGAGPAGATAAVRLARAGASVTLFDPSHPREKPCGGGLTGRALALIGDVVDIRALPSVVVKSASVESTHRTADVPLIDRGPTSDSSLIVVSRAVFDRSLVDAAVASGARLVAEKVVAVAVHPACVTVRTSGGQQRFDYILGADGANSLVRKRLARPFGRDELSVATGFFVHGATSSTIAIKMMSEQPGYLWSFPRRDHLAVGVCAAAAHRASSGTLRAQSASWIQQHGFARDAQMLEPYAWPIPSIGYQRSSAVTLGGPRWMLLGDAAGLVDPLTREGIYYALLSAQWAADALVAAQDAAAAHYAARILGTVQPELDRAASLSRVFFTPAFSSLLTAALAESEAIGRVFADLVGGVQPYRGLRRRLLGTREWRLAARAIRLLLTPGFAGTMTPAALPQEM